MRIDLHTHSTASDGTDTPAQLVRKAAAAGLDVVALTDHDTTRGHAEAVAALPEGLTLVTGAELSCRLDGISMHMLAYLFDPEEPALLAERELVRDDRVPRARSMVARLNELGVPVTWEQVARIAGDGSVGRPHVATALVELGVVPTVNDAFTQDWLADGGRAHVAKHETDPFEALRLIKGAGGVAVFAHPAAAKRGRTVSEGRDRRPGGRRARRHRGRPHGPRRGHAGSAARDGEGAGAPGDRLQRLPRQPEDLCARRAHDRPRGVRGDHATGVRGVPRARGRRGLSRTPRVHLSTPPQGQ
ncbi:putative metal-dependent phosphoesterase TrpH [Streptomyces ambofaciens]